MVFACYQSVEDAGGYREGAELCAGAGIDDLGAVAGGPREPLVGRQQGHVQGLGERDIRRVVGAVAFAKFPDPLRKRCRRVACDRSRCQIGQRLLCALGAKSSARRHTAQCRNDFHISEIEGVM